MATPTSMTEESNLIVLEEASKCPICMDVWTSDGEHRVVAIKCGHIYGMSCITRWIDTALSRCPQCQEAITIEDVRVLYPPVVFAARAAPVTNTQPKSTRHGDALHPLVRALVDAMYFKYARRERYDSAYNAHMRARTVYNHIQRDAPEMNFFPDLTQEDVDEFAREYEEARTVFTTATDKCNAAITALNEFCLSHELGV